MISIVCKPMTEVAPQAKLLESQESSGGTASSGSYLGAQVSTTTNPTLKKTYVVEEVFLQNALTVSNVSGNSDVTDYPIIRRADPNFTGADVVMLELNGYKRQLNLNYTTFVGDTVKQVTAITEASTYLRYSYEWLAAKHAAGGAAAVYSGASRNAGCWLFGEDLTGIPYSNTTSGGARRSGALIARRYLAGANHYPIEVGASVTFKTAAGENETRTVIGVSELGTGAGDLRICVLSSDLPETIKSYPVAGRWLANATGENPTYFDTAVQYCGVFLNRNRDASFVHKCDHSVLQWPKKNHTIAGIAVSNALTTFYIDALFSEYKLPEFAALSSIRINPDYGDSGSAILVPVTGGLAVAAVFTSGTGGPFFDEAFVNACIASARLDAIARGHAAPTLQTVTVAPDPTI